MDKEDQGAESDLAPTSTAREDVEIQPPAIHITTKLMEG